MGSAPPGMGPPGMVPPGMGPGMGPGMVPGMGPGMGMDEGTPLRRYDFILQFGWQPAVPGAPKPAAEGEAAAN